jgi:hypothetical protein
MQTFDELKLVGDTLHEIYQDACNDLGLLVNDSLYNETLKEASISRSGFHICQLFAMMCVHTPPLDPKKLFEAHYEAFTNDVPQVNMTDCYSRMFSLEER